MQLMRYFSSYNWELDVGRIFKTPTVNFATIDLETLTILLLYRSRKSLHPVIFLFENSPDYQFLNAISYFPMVYFTLGNMNG